MVKWNIFVYRQQQQKKVRREFSLGPAAILGSSPSSWIFFQYCHFPTKGAKIKTNFLTSAEWEFPNYLSSLLREFLRKKCVFVCWNFGKLNSLFSGDISRNIKFDLRRKTNEENFFRIVNAILVLVRFSALGHSISFWRKWNFHTYIYFTFTPELTTNDDNESEFSCLSTDRFLGRDYPVDGEKLAKVHRARTTASR